MTMVEWKVAMKVVLTVGTTAALMVDQSDDILVVKMAALMVDLMVLLTVV